MDTGAIRTATADDGVLLQYEVAGPVSGEPVVFLHGGLASRFAFRRQKPALVERYRLVLRDLRGHNGTEPRVPANYGIDTTEVADLRAVMDAEGIARSHLVGHSTGGAIAFAFARRYPERVGRLVLLEPTFMSFLPEEVIMTAGLAMTDEVRLRMEREGPAAAVHGGLETILGPDWRARVPPEALAQMEKSAPIIVAQGEGLRSFNVTEDDIRSLAAPALFIYGARTYAWERPIREAVRALRPDLPILIVEESGHNTYSEQPDRVNAAIRDFLGAG
jgi:pimeloyl-ACP methyl ester carboxylesterase